MFLIHLKADLPFREEKTDLMHPISTLYVLGKAYSSTFYVTSELTLSTSTSHPFIQPPGCVLQLRQVEPSKVKWKSAVSMKHRDDEKIISVAKDIASEGLKKVFICPRRRITITDRNTKLYLTLVH